MRAGNLTSTIQIQRRGETVDDYGTVTEGWSNVATIRAQIVQQSTDEFLRSAGTVSETGIVFRIRWRADLSNEDRVTYQGQEFDLKEIREIGRRKGLDLRCTGAGG
jgi:SPP1 family predicted phage head-tail adaptor